MSEPLWQTLDRVTAKNKELCARIAELERQLAERRQPTAQQVEDARDAARYRFIRSQTSPIGILVHGIEEGHALESMDEVVDETIAALQAGKEKER
ncbi:MAG TPA: hypothetical protein VN081_07015 [Dongiaceae bacterium]|nr:hypothetical protein [Dongiaceae bacterium]